MEAEKTNLLAPDHPLSYEEERLTLKLGPFYAAVILMQSTIGISIFTLHQPMAKVGVGFAALVSAFALYLTIYGATRMDWVATRLETRNPPDHPRVKNSFEIFGLMPSKFGEVVKWLTIFSNLCLVGASPISNIILLGILVSTAQCLEKSFGIPTLITKILVCFLIWIVFFMIVEPEKIDKLSSWVFFFMFTTSRRLSQKTSSLL